MKRQDDPFERFRKVLVALSGLITALTTAAVAGHGIGWW
jgi:hypothetical protein